MIRTIAVWIVTLAASAAWADVDVERFIDRLTQVNPTDRWIDSGTVEFTMQHSEENSGNQVEYVCNGRLSFSGSDALYERCLVSGEFPKPKDAKPTARAAKHIFLAITKDGWSATSTSGRNVLHYKTRDVTVDNFSFLTAGVPRHTIATDVLMMPSRTVGTALVFTPQGGKEWQFRVDDAGRLVEFRQTDGHSTRTFLYENHVKVLSRWVPQTVTIHTSNPEQNRESCTVFGLIFKPGIPSAETLRLPERNGKSLADGLEDMAIWKNGSPATKFYEYHQMICQDQEPCYWQASGMCCDNGCNDTYSWQQFESHCCRHTVNWVNTCEMWYQVYRVEWPGCYWVPYQPEWCPTYQCYPDGTHIHYIEDLLCLVDEWHEH